jgi:hypothetical protein
VVRQSSDRRYIKVLKPKSSYRGLDSPKIRKNLLDPSVYREVAQRTDLSDERARAPVAPGFLHEA